MIEPEVRPGARPKTPGESAGADNAWLAFWFTPTDPRPLEIARICVGLLGLGLLWSYAGELDRWFGPEGLVPREVAAGWGGRGGVWLAEAVHDLLGTRGPWFVALAAYAAVTVGLGGSAAAVVAALSWAAILHRGPMLAGPADDCLAVLTWCMAVGPTTGGASLDRFLARSPARTAPRPSWRAGLALGLVRLHASAIAAAAALSQLKGDAWWDGTAAWWLTARVESRTIDLTAAYTTSTYLLNLVTHLIPGFELAFALGLWHPTSRTVLARAGLVAWPVIGVLVGEPWWGLALAIFCVPLAIRRDDRLHRTASRPRAAP